MEPFRADSRWYESYFGEDWLNAAIRVSPEQTSGEVDFVVDALGLAPASRVLDVACGHGRHSLELARRGYAVVGVDLSEPSLSIARQDAASRGLDVRFVRSDMRDMTFLEEFDAAINMFTHLAISNPMPRTNGVSTRYLGLYGLVDDS
jgi:2-polyprenyl-3-methyl-5-hydroxy-6-metoxy-1,4-benzoquinol methylase